MSRWDCAGGAAGGLLCWQERRLWVNDAAAGGTEVLPTLCLLLTRTSTPPYPPHPTLPQQEYLAQTMALQLTLMAEDSNRNLHKFRGRAEIRAAQAADMPLTGAAADAGQSGENGAVTAGGRQRLLGTGVQLKLLMLSPVAFGVRRLCSAPHPAKPDMLATSHQTLLPHAAVAGDAPPVVEVPVTMNEMLLRGCMLKNSGFVTGLVVYTGRETRIQMNAAKTPLKIGACLFVGG